MSVVNAINVNENSVSGAKNASLPSLLPCFELNCRAEHEHLADG